MNWVRKRASVRGEIRVRAMVVRLVGVVILGEATMAATWAEVVEETLEEAEVVTLAVVVAISNVQGDGIAVPLLIFANWSW